MHSGVIEYTSATCSECLHPPADDEDKSKHWQCNQVDIHITHVPHKASMMCACTSQGVIAVVAIVWRSALPHEHRLCPSCNNCTGADVYTTFKAAPTPFNVCVASMELQELQTETWLMIWVGNVRCQREQCAYVTYHQSY